MTGQHDPFAHVFGTVRGSAERWVEEPPTRPPELDAERLERLREHDVEDTWMWDFAWETAGDIEHDPRFERHLSNDGEPFLRYPATAPCQVVVEPDGDEAQRRFGRKVSGTMQALVWELRAAGDPAPSDESLLHNWDLSVGNWELDEQGVTPLIWQPASAPCSVEVRTVSGERVVGLLRALLLPVTPDLLARL